MYKLLLSFALTAGIATSVSAYEPPIGIPDPGSSVYEWGNNHPIDAKAPSKPSNWNSAVDGFYYVDPDASGSTDSDNTNGYPGKARKTMPSTVPAGSYVQVKGSFNSDTTIKYLCTASQPCWLRGDDNDRPNLTTRLSIDDSSYVFVEHFNFHGGTGGAVNIVGESHHIVLRNSSLKDRLQPNGNSAGISILPGYNTSMRSIVIYNNEFISLGDWTVAEDLDFHGVAPSLWGRDSTSELKDLWILENNCKNLSGDCVQVNAGNWTDAHKYLHHVYIGKNTSFQNRQSGFWVKQASDVIISQNDAYGNKGNGSSNAGAGIGYQYEKNNLWIIYNNIHESVFGIRQSDTGSKSLDSNVYIIGNLIHDIAPSASNSTYDPNNLWHQGVGIALWHGNLDRYIVDNTIHNVGDGIVAMFNGYVEISGNIINDVRNNPDGFMISSEHPARNGQSAYDHNLFFDDDAINFRTWAPNKSVVTSGLSSLKSNVNAVTSNKRLISSNGTCESCKSGDPQFVNADSNNFNLQSTSPAIAANTKHGAYDAFKARYGIDIYVDYNGNQRSINNSSMGALEANSLVSPPAQMSAPNFQVIN